MVDDYDDDDDDDDDDGDGNDDDDDDDDADIMAPFPHRRTSRLGSFQLLRQRLRQSLRVEDAPARYSR